MASKIALDSGQKRNLRRRPRKTSVRLYIELAGKYDIYLSCDMCLELTADGQASARDFEHQCSKTALIIIEKINNQNGFLIRKKPFEFQQYGEMCEHVGTREHCPERQRCRWPHCELERDLWRREVKGEVSVASFIEDLAETSLQVKYVVEHLCQEYHGVFKLFCGKCYDSESKMVDKKKHNPLCKEGHSWERYNGLFFVSDEQEEYLRIDGIGTAMELSENDRKILDNANLLLQTENIDKDVIVEISKKFKLSKEKRKARTVSSSISEDKYEAEEKETYDEDAEMQKKTKYFVRDEDDIYDSDFEDLLDSSAYDDDTGDIYKGDTSEAFSDKYYKMLPPSEALELVKTGPPYFRATIELKNAFQAVCRILGDTKEGEEIEVTGRANCGPAFFGDEVVVEEKKVREADCDSFVCKGKVISIIKRNTNRTARTFVCKVDKVKGNLMRPLCNSVPKLHIIDTFARKIIDKNRIDNYVTVYDSSIKLRKIFRLDLQRRENMIFIVKYLKWDDTYMYPLGYCCHVIRRGEDLESSQKILNAIYEVKATENKLGVEDNEEPAENETGEEDRSVNSLAEHLSIAVDFNNVSTGSENSSTTSRPEVKCSVALPIFRNKTIITIDPAGSEDLDDALGLLQLEDGNYEVSVHVADVSGKVRRGSDIDVEAMRRGQTNYSALDSGPYHMLPFSMAENLLSLVEHEQRDTLTVIYKMNASGVIIEPSPTIEERKIVVDANLTYDEAQRIINGQSAPRGLGARFEEVVRILFAMSTHIRYRRLHGGQHYFEYDRRSFGASWTSEQNPCFDSKRLVEEFMILANLSVASFLMSNFPTCTPLRTQSPPKTERMDNWYSKHCEVLPLSFYFQQFGVIRSFLEQLGENDIASNTILLTQIYDALLKAIEEGRVNEIERIVGTELLHPLHLMAIMEWFSIQELARYTCSNSGAEESNSHFGLQLNHYVQFTSPIRRYLDIVVHRLVKNALSGQEAEYTQNEIRDLCRRTTRSTKRGKDFDKACTLLKIAIELRKPKYLTAIVNELDNFNISLNVPQIIGIKHKQKMIPFSKLSLDRAPNVQDGRTRLVWKKRMYDTREHETPDARSQEDSAICRKLDERIHGVLIAGSQWMEIQNRIRQGATRSITSDMLALNEDESDSSTDSEIEADNPENDIPEENIERRLLRGYRRHITSEMEEGIILRHFVKFSLQISLASVMCVQMGTAIINGSLLPEIKAVSLTPTLDLCVEHVQNPIGCFSAIATRSRRQNYDNIDDYQNIWLPILSMESATNAMRSEDSIICDNVPIVMLLRNGNYFGKLVLDSRFCSERKIKFSNTEDCSEDTSDYLCVRYYYEENRKRQLWVCHAIAIEIKEVGERKKIQFKVTHKSFQPPNSLLDDPRINSCTCSVEFLPRNISDRRMIEAVSNLLLPDISPLCRCIALGRHLKPIIENLRRAYHHIIFPDYLKEQYGLKDLYNNQQQEIAIKESLKNQFTLIQGPPGTGKTLIGIKIAYWLVKANEEAKAAGEERKQILCCGPSNSSVDVIAVQLKNRLMCNKIHGSPRIVRVYSEVKENEDYPIPRDIYRKRTKKKHVRVPRKYCLHHIIRQEGKPYCRELDFYRRRFEIYKNRPEVIRDEEIIDYQKLVLEASVEEMKQYDVILCTCSASSSAKFQKGAKNVRQIIIDECAMSMEPNSMVAISNFKKAEQVILIGDHKQLRPIVMNKDAAELGLEISLFERYATKDKHKLIMLDTQYRMGKLKTAQRSAWFEREDHFLGIWPSPNYPMVFCHVEGIEKTQSVTTAEGNEQSKSNEEECHHVRRFARELINTVSLIMGHEYPNPQKNIAILTQYNAQRAAIEEGLKQDGLNDVTVRTVVASQGDEWDYVILSTVRSIDPYEIDEHASPGWIKSYLGFVADPNQINVALTRARQGLIIVGNKNLLRCDMMWRNLLEFYDERRCLVNAEDFLTGPIVPGYAAANIPRLRRRHRQQKQQKQQQQQQQQQQQGPRGGQGGRKK